MLACMLTNRPVAPHPWQPDTLDNPVTEERVAHRCVVASLTEETTRSGDTPVSCTRAHPRMHREPTGSANSGYSRKQTHRYHLRSCCSAMLSLLTRRGHSTGRIPDALRSLTQLRGLELGGNMLTGKFYVHMWRVLCGRSDTDANVARFVADRPTSTLDRELPALADTPTVREQADRAHSR